MPEHCVPPCDATPWPLLDILRVLADATRHLLEDHDCDRDGHETMRLCVDYATTYIRQVEGETSSVMQSAARQ